MPLLRTPTACGTVMRKGQACDIGIINQVVVTLEIQFCVFLDFSKQVLLNTERIWDHIKMS